MQGVLRKLSSDPQAATTTVQTLAQILDPSLTDKDLGAFLAKLADRAKGGDYKTALLPVQTDGTLSAQASDSVVKDVLGGAAKSPEQGRGRPGRHPQRHGRQGRHRTGPGRPAERRLHLRRRRRGPLPPRPRPRSHTPTPPKKANAVEVAKTLGLPTSSVKKGKDAANADVSVVLGQDYKRRRVGSRR